MFKDMTPEDKEDEINALSQSMDDGLPRDSVFILNVIDQSNNNNMIYRSNARPLGAIQALKDMARILTERN